MCQHKKYQTTTLIHNKGIVRGSRHNGLYTDIKIFNIRDILFFIPLYVSIYQDHHQVVFMNYVCCY
jgi:hypothetical protein